MANKICKRMQDEFTEVIRGIFPIRDIASRISKDQKDADDVFDTKEVTLKKSKRLSTKVQFHTLIFSGIFLLSRWSPQDQSTPFQF